MNFVDGRPGAVVRADDRGLLYGDGLFETIRFEGDEAPLWELHMDRLRRDGNRIGLSVPAPDRLLGEARGALAGRPRGLVRVTLTRGAGARGYAPPTGAAVTRVVSGHDLPAPPAAPLRLVLCASRPLECESLAGMKHLSRLAEVLAAAEVRRRGADEGLLTDSRGYLVEAVSANLFLRRGGRWLTPELHRAGVAGVLRRWWLERGLVQETRLRPEDLEGCEAVCLANSVRGPQPVQDIAGVVAFEPGAARRALEDLPCPWPARP